MSYTKTSIIVTVIAGIIFIASAISSIHKVVADKISCPSFQSQQQAQLAFNRDPVFYKKLDHNHDGKVCTDYQYNQ